jgi:DNA recombination protein RmuC
MHMSDVLFTAGAFFIIAILGLWIILLKRTLALKSQALEFLQIDHTSIMIREAQLSATLDAQAAARTDLERTQSALREQFESLSNQVLRATQQDFLTLAKGQLGQMHTAAASELESRKQAIDACVQPLTEKLKRVDEHIAGLESARTGAYASIKEQIQQLLSVSHNLRAETTTLSRALKASHIRGQWGELQLRRVVELAGMLEYVDFVTQVTTENESGRQRPDMCILLPNERRIVVDAKTPLSAYMEAADATDEVHRTNHLKQHARQLRDHLQVLGAKKYWQQFEHAPEFVVLFLPAEAFLSAALEQDPQLIEYGVGQGVILATPTTLIALLKTIALGWSQEKMALEARQISELGRELHDRLRVWLDHLSELRRSIQGAGKAYNQAIASLESRVIPSARRFEQLQPSLEKALPDLKYVEGELKETSLNFRKYSD